MVVGEEKSPVRCTGGGGGDGGGDSGGVLCGTVLD